MYAYAYEMVVAWMKSIENRARQKYVIEKKRAVV